MSKSKGNVIDPLILADKYGVDAMRFTLAAMAAQGRDVLMSESRVEGYRNFVTKLWNAARFCEMNECRAVKGFDPKSVENPLNKWIVSKAAQAHGKVTTAFDEYKFNEAANAAYQFVWGTFCDWYLEFAKPLFFGDDESAKAETRATAAWVLERILIMLHPIMPFVTEELWGKTDHDKMLIVTDWGDLRDLVDSAAETDLDWVVDLVAAVRSLRSEMNIAPSAKITMLLGKASDAEIKRLEKFGTLIKTLARLEKAEISTSADDEKGAAQAVFGTAEILLPLAGVIDVAKETERLNKEKANLEKTISSLSGRLNNESFVAKAPAAVVEEQKKRLEEAQTALKNVGGALERLKSL